MLSAITTVAVRKISISTSTLRNICFGDSEVKGPVRSSTAPPIAISAMSMPCHGEAIQRATTPDQDACDAPLPEITRGGFSVQHTQGGAALIARHEQDKDERNGNMAGKQC